jgi:hypothetical protein
MAVKKKRCTLVVSENQVKVLIHGLPHIVLRQSEFVGFHAWIDGYANEKYFIKFYLKTNSIEVEYDREEIWKEVLQLLNSKNLFFH